MIKLDIKNIEKSPAEWPDIFNFKEDISKIRESLQKYQNKKNLILIGNGGSITSFDAYAAALHPDKKTTTLWTMEPDQIKKTKENYRKEDTVVVAVSKSGNTLGLIETLLYFVEYEVICVTDPKAGTLSEMAKQMNWEIITHPPVGGRFSGGTSSAFVPAILCSLEVEAIQKGLEEGYKLKDQAYSLAKYFYDLEKKGYEEVFLPIYSSRLKNFQNLIIQLMHESVCKDGKGQTYYTALAPEAQHHTNQRFLGGKKNVMGLFIIVEKPENDLKIEVPKEISDIDYKEEKLSFIQGLSYQKALWAEYIGTKRDADAKNIPNITISIEKITTESVGQLTSFWHLMAYYSSLLRDVNAFDQPAVEESKNITLEVIKHLKE